MSLPRYAKYRHSGLEWLGHVPAHWRVLPLGRVATSRCDGPFGSGLKSEHYTETGVRVVRLQNIRREGFDETDAAFVDIDYYQRELAGHDVVEGDLLIAGLGDDNNAVGRACVAPHGIEPAMVKADCFRFRLDPTAALTGFVAASLCASAEADAGRMASGSTRSRIPLSQMSFRKVPVPPLAEQVSILAFLDRETAKIDALVAEQQRLIELLNEKRQAVISHAVTKGLNPDARMKDSGLPWIGEVPAHWTLPPLYVRYDQALGKMLDQAKMTGEHPTPYLRNLDVRWDHFDLDDLPLIDIRPEERDRYMVRRGDLLMVEGRELGRCAIWTGEDNVVAFQKALHRLRPKNASECTRYLYYTMAFANRVGVFFADHSPNEIPHLTGEELRRYRLPKPPRGEQEAIVEFLDRETQTFAGVEVAARQLTDLLIERRSALISAAVTGQIDVRDAAARSAA